MTILGELWAEVQEALRRNPTKTLLWLDPQHEWERLLGQLATEFELVKYDGSQLELRMKIEVEPVQTSRIVYLPLARQALSALKEYEFTLPVWERRPAPRIAPLGCWDRPRRRKGTAASPLHSGRPLVR